MFSYSLLRLDGSGNGWRFVRAVQWVGSDGDFENSEACSANESAFVDLFETNAEEMPHC
jgi:hypothetical protein